MGYAKVKHVLRVWEETRTSHFELLKSLLPSTLLYRRRNYSFDEREARNLDIRRTGTFRACHQIATARYGVLELNEPTMFKAWPRLLLFSVVARCRRRLSGDIRVVLYAIDNLSIRSTLASTLRLPIFVISPLARPLFKFLFATFDRVAFGSDGAHLAYSDALGFDPMSNSDRCRVIPQLPSACDCPTAPQEADHVLFVGSLEYRKGVEILMQSWPSIVQQRPTAKLRIVGIGPLEKAVVSWARNFSSVEVEIDPPREDVHRYYRLASAVVLPSRRTARWREQIGLPIVEGLSHGCTIITTSETGIQDWLASMGHYVVDAGDIEGLGSAVVEALNEPMDRASVLGSLPTEHARVTADKWLSS